MQHQDRSHWGEWPFCLLMRSSFRDLVRESTTTSFDFMILFFSLTHLQPGRRLPELAYVSVSPYIHRARQLEGIQWDGCRCNLKKQIPPVEWYSAAWQSVFGTGIRPLPQSE